MELSGANLSSKGSRVVPRLRAFQHAGLMPFGGVGLTKPRNIGVVGVFFSSSFFFFFFFFFFLFGGGGCYGFELKGSWPACEMRLEKGASASPRNKRRHLILRFRVQQKKLPVLSVLHAERLNCPTSLSFKAPDGCPCQIGLTVIEAPQLLDA